MKRLFYMFPAMVWTIIIIVASLISGSKLKKIPLKLEFGDKLIHFFIYAVLSFLIGWGLYKYKRENNIQRLWLISLIVSSGIGLILEILQNELTSTRSFDIYDIIANIIGAFIGSTIFLLRYK